MPTSIVPHGRRIDGRFKQQVRDRVPWPLLVFYRFFRTRTQGVFSRSYWNRAFSHSRREAKTDSGIYRVSSHVAIGRTLTCFDGRSRVPNEQSRSCCIGRDSRHGRSHLSVLARRECEKLDSNKNERTLLPLLVRKEAIRKLIGAVAPCPGLVV